MEIQLCVLIIGLHCSSVLDSDPASGNLNRHNPCPDIDVQPSVNQLVEDSIFTESDRSMQNYSSPTSIPRGSSSSGYESDPTRSQPNGHNRSPSPYETGSKSENGVTTYTTEF